MFLKNSSFTPMDATNECRPDVKAKGVVSPVRGPWRTRVLHGGSQQPRKNGHTPSENFVNNLEGELPHRAEPLAILENRSWKWKRRDGRNRFHQFHCLKKRKNVEGQGVSRKTFSAMNCTCFKLVFAEQRNTLLCVMDSRMRSNFV